MLSQLDEITVLEIKKLKSIQIKLHKNRRFALEIMHSKRPIEQAIGHTQIYDGKSLKPLNTQNHISLTNGNNPTRSNCEK